MKTPRVLEIAPEHRKQLETIANSEKSEVDQTLRAKILLKKAQGMSNTIIAADLGVNRHTVELWVNRYRDRDANVSLVDLLSVAEGRGAKPDISGLAKTWIIAEACTRPTDLGYAAESWTYSALTKHIRSKAAEAGFPRLATISRNEVYCILEKSNIKPFRIKYYCEKKDPDFNSMMHNLLLLYKKLGVQFDIDGKLLPAEDGEYVHILSYDEKPDIQAITNASPDLPPKPGEHSGISRDYEYKRKGTLSLLAAIDLQTGEAIPLIRTSHKSEDYIDFLKIVDSSYPKEHTVCIVLDNLRVHTSQKTRDYLSTVPGRFRFVFTPKHGSWLNLVESFFSRLTKQMLRGIRVKSLEELQERLYKYFEEVNADPVVYHWEWKLDEVGISGEVNTTTLLEKKV